MPDLTIVTLNSVYTIKRGILARDGIRLGTMTKHPETAILMGAGMVARLDFTDDTYGQPQYLRTSLVRSITQSL